MKNSFTFIIILYLSTSTYSQTFNCSFWQGQWSDLPVVGDFNGDGLTDMAGHAGSGQWNVSLSNGSGFDNYWWQGQWSSFPIVGDFNGDGMTDMAGYADSGQWNVSLSNGSGFDNFWWQGQWSSTPVVGDFNGDGMTDMAGYSGFGNWVVSLSNGSGFDSATWAGQWDSVPVAGDFNGDGKTDMAGYSGSGAWVVALSTGDGFEMSTWQAQWDDTPAVGDFDGNGLTDMAGHSANGLWNVSLSTGSGFDSPFWPGQGDATPSLGDFNGDGKTDMAGFTYNAGIWHICLSTGSGFDCYFETLQGDEVPVMGDFNGDGLTDMAGYGGFGRWHVCLAQSVLPVEYTKELSATKRGKSNILDWSTANEESNMEFEVQRSINETEWEVIGSVPSLGSYGGAYEYEDVSAESFATVHYRLVQRDYDGSEAFSIIASVSRTIEGSLTLYPNPFQDDLQISFGQDVVGDVLVFNSIGARVFKQSVSGNQSIDLSALPNGVYVIHGFIGKAHYVRKVIKSN